MNKKNGKKVVTVLLAVSCVISGYMLISVPSPTIKAVHTIEDIDSLITIELLDAQIKPQQIRLYEYPTDSSFTRKLYRVRVPSRFSKTIFHLNVHNTFLLYNMEVPAKVTFPEQDMDIHIYYEDTIFRSIRLVTDTRLDTLIIGIN